MRQSQDSIEVRTRAKSCLDVSDRVISFVADSGIAQGLLTVFVRHTSASLVIQENADPDVLRDLEDFFARVVPEDAARYRHSIEGSDDMPAHIRSALTQTQLSIPVSNGRPVLGTWQGIYLYEHRARPHSRTLVLHIVGE